MAAAQPRCHPAQVPSAAVSVEVVVDDGGSTGRGRMTVLTMLWRPEDPLAVELLLTPQPDHPALPRGRWIVLRDFLRYGLDEPTGDGDVRIRPDERRDRVELELARPGRAACVSVPRATAADFLDRTEQAVPRGSERSAEALEALLDRLLGGEPPQT
ncbi:MAG: Sporulation and cell division protein SsgA [uncultured Frankineae bacterium]|uniref:Sporulation and cell division protein SsgA n=1 Tax=uncultured Frankineae bacterium TaxID=437475 RepID=A0A6J4M2Z9_9ACTN|nr:MAG: Sporulation and cell division protein SsgA [uncultured Frankineae bacterium]